MGVAELKATLASLGDAGAVAKDLDATVDEAMATVISLSPLSNPLGVSYMDRLARPIASLTPVIGVALVARGYLAHVAIERDPARFGLTDVPVLGDLPERKKGRLPQDLLSRVVKASRGRSFQAICALNPRQWEALVMCFTKRAHDLAGTDGEYVPTDVVDGVARFAWVLRQTDIFYGYEPELAH